MAMQHRWRLLTAAVALVLLFFTMPSAMEPSTRLLVAWDVAVLIYLALVWAMMVGSRMDDMRERSTSQDEGRLLTLALTLAAAVASLGAIVAELQGIHGGAVENEPWRVGLVALTIMCSWFFVHTIFALHYAHYYYATDENRPGMRFPEHVRDPSYWDFLYVAFTIGAASQTSDVSMATREIRRLALAHTIFSFLFNTMILALAVNVGASLV